MPIPQIFNNTNLWIRMVDKRGRIKALLDASQVVNANGPRNSSQALQDTFLEELAGYGGFYFNTANKEIPEYWKLRNELNPVLNSILFIPSIKITVENSQKEGDNITFQNTVDLLLNEIIPSNSNLNNTQIGNLQSVLDKIKNTIPKYPLGHQDLKNIIKINSFETKWITESFLTQEATLEIYFEHHQLLKTQLAKELMRPNKRIKLETKFYNVFDGWNDIEVRNFMSSLGFDDTINLFDPTNTFLSRYNKFINASSDNKDTDWVIYNFDTAFDENDGVMLTIKLVKHAMPVLKQKSFRNIKPINLLTKEVVDFFNESEIMKISDGELYGKSRSDVGLAFIPKIAMDNRDNSKSRNSNLNLTKTTYMIIDASKFIIYLLWLYVIKYKEYFDETEGLVNKDKMSNNFVITFEMDMSNPQSENALRERFNGCLMSYINTSTSNEKKYKSIGLFDFEKTKNLFDDSGNKFTDVLFPFVSSASSVDIWRWNLNQEDLEINNKKIEIKGFESGDDNSYLFSSLIRQASQENLLESISVSAFGQSNNTKTESTEEWANKVGIKTLDLSNLTWDQIIKIKQYGVSDLTANDEDIYALIEKSVNHTITNQEMKQLTDMYRIEGESGPYKQYEKKLRRDIEIEKTNLKFSAWEDLFFDGDVDKAIQASKEWTNNFSTSAINKSLEFKVGDVKYKIYAWEIKGHYKLEQQEKNIENDTTKIQSQEYQQTPSIPKRYVNSYYKYPLLKMSVSDDDWLGHFDSTVDSFARTQLINLFDYTKNAEAHFKTQNYKTLISFDGNIIKKESNFSSINKLPWITEKNKIGNIFDDGDDYVYKNDSKHESLIYQQVSNFESLKFTVIPRNKNSKLDEITKQFVNENILKNNENIWLEIKISDTNSFILNDSEQKIYAKIQNDVFKKLDTKDMVMMNQISDNNIISFKSSSETISDAPYQLGVFNPHVVGEESYEKKIQNIRNVLNNITTISDEDRAKIDNSLALMKLIVKSGVQRTDSIKNIVGWACNANKNLEDINLFNSISGSYFINDISNVGTKERLMSSLYDLLYYEITTESWYVPTFEPFIPFLLYTGGDKTKSMFGKIITNPEYDVNNDNQLLNHLHNRISPQSGMYYITEMSDKIYNNGMWIQSWKGRKYDFGFINTIYKQLFASDENSYLSPNISYLNNLQNTFHSTNYVLNKFDNTVNFAYKNCKTPIAFEFFIDNKVGNFFNTNCSETNSFIEEISKILPTKWAYENFGIQDGVDHKFILFYQYLIYNLFIKIYRLVKFNLYDDIEKINLTKSCKNDLWIEYDNTKISDLFESFRSNKSQAELNYKFGNSWFNYETFKNYNLTPEYLLASNKINNKIKNFPEDSEFNSGTVFNDLYSYITRSESHDFIYNIESLNKKLSSIQSYPGIFINVQRQSHPSIDEETLIPYENLIIDKEKITAKELLYCDNFKINNIIYDNNGWKSIEKYLILDESIMGNFFKNKMPTIEIKEMYLGSWDDYKYHSSAEGSEWYNYLQDLGLSDVSDLDIDNFMKKSFIRSTWKFITNFNDDYDYIQLKRQGSVSSATINYTSISAASTKAYSYYKKFNISETDYKEYIDDFYTKYWEPYFKTLYDSNVMDRINKRLESMTGISESEMDNRIDSMIRDYKKDFSAQILNKEFQNFINKWIQDNSEYDTKNKLIPFDFIFKDLESDSKIDTFRFSAIRWKYNETKTNLFGGEFVSNMSFRDIIEYENRKEDNLEEKNNIKKQKAKPMRWVFGETEWFEDITYDYKTKKFSAIKSKEEFQKKYGKIRIFIDDRWTYEKLAISPS